VFWIGSIAVGIVSGAWASTFGISSAAVVGVLFSAYFVIIRAWAGDSIIEVHQKCVHLAVLWVNSIATHIISWAWAGVDWFWDWFLLDAMGWVIFSADLVVHFAWASVSISLKHHEVSFSQHHEVSLFQIHQVSFFQHHEITLSAFLVFPVFLPSFQHHEDRVVEAVIWVGSIASGITNWAWASILWCCCVAVVWVFLSAYGIISWARAGCSIIEVHKSSKAVVWISSIAISIISWAWAHGSHILVAVLSSICASACKVLWFARATNGVVKVHHNVPGRSGSEESG